MKYFSAVALLSLVFFSSCHFFHGRTIEGDGNVVMQTRPVSDFRRIDVSGAIDVYVTQDPVFSVKVEIDNNLQEFVEVYTDGDALKIHQADNTNLKIKKEKINVYVTAPVYKKLNASGACNFYGKNKLTPSETMDIDLSGASNAKLELDAAKIEVRLAGAGAVELDGETNELDVHGAGSTTVKCFDMIAQHVEINMAGASNAQVYAGVSLKIDIAGAGSVKYKGSPEVNQNVSGSGSVEKVQ